jgi:putative transposase
MVEKDHPRLSITEQCRLLSISRSAFYYEPKGETALNLVLMRQIDEQFLETPFYGVRQMTWHLRAEGRLVNEKRIRRLMRLMGLMPIYQRPNTSRKAKGHKIWPYLLRGMAITRPNQVWCADVTYIPMRRGFLYLVAIMDWATRKVLSWRLSNTLEADFCIEALNEALARFGPPDIMNTDQGSQFTSWAWTDRQRKAGVKISMDGKGRFLDNILVVYLNAWLYAWSGGREARDGIGRWVEFYNKRRPHTALGGRSPATAYWFGRETEKPDWQAKSVA